MTKKKKIITALDIGASKVCCLIAYPEKDNVIEVLGYGISHHDSLKQGIVSDINALSDAIAKAVYDAEEISGEKVQSTLFNISGHHIKGVTSRGEVLISDRDNEITKHDVDRVLANARAIHMPYERDVIYTVSKGYTVDDEKGILNPSGMFGIKLETELFLVSAKIAVVDNLKKAVRQSGISIESSALSGICTSCGVLSSNEKDLGVVLIDIGADMTEILIFLDGRLNHLSVLSVGGDSITKALSDKLRLPEGAAERIKLEHGRLDEDSRQQSITVDIGSRKRTITTRELRNILIYEYTKVFNAIRNDLEKSGCAQDASSGAVICGQPAMMDGSLELAEHTLNMPVRKGHIMGLGSSPKPLPSHVYATCVGMLKLGSEQRRLKRSFLTMGPKNSFMSLVNKAKQLYHDYF